LLRVYKGERWLGGVDIRRHVVGRRESVGVCDAIRGKRCSLR
jgi:hypothetical protein